MLRPLRALSALLLAGCCGLGAFQPAREVAIPLRVSLRSPGDVEVDLLYAMEGAAQQLDTESFFGGEARCRDRWTLIQLNPTVLGFALEYRAAILGTPDSTYRGWVRDAERRLSRSGERAFLALLDPCGTPEIASKITIVNQAGEEGALLESTPTIAAGARTFFAPVHGLWYFWDVVRSSDATFAIVASRDEGALQHRVWSASFDATDSQVVTVMATRYAASHPTEAVVTIEGRRVPDVDTNGDGFSIGDAIAVASLVVDAAGVAVGIAGLVPGVPP